MQIADNTPCPYLHLRLKGVCRNIPLTSSIVKIVPAERPSTSGK